MSKAATGLAAIDDTEDAIDGYRHVLDSCETRWSEYLEATAD